MSGKNIPKAGQSAELSESQLEAFCKRLNLAHMRRIYQQVVDRAEKESWSYRDFLALLLAEEVAHRKQTRLQRCTRGAHFPFFKTIDEFDHPAIERAAILARLLSRTGLRHRGPLFDPVRQDRKRKNPSRRGHRLSCHSEWLRDFLHHRGRTDRGSF